MGFYSTVTNLARLRGWSAPVSLYTATKQLAARMQRSGLNSIGSNLLTTSLWLTLRAITKKRDVQK